MYYMWLYFLEHLCFSLSKLGPCLDDLWGRGKCKLELLIYLKLIKLSNANCLPPPSPFHFKDHHGGVSIFV